MEKEEWKIILEEIECGLECAEEEANFIRTSFLESIKYYIQKALEETERE